jgi:4-hydroxy-3-polyprenylbenzoate decarboxylase
MLPQLKEVSSWMPVKVKSKRHGKWKMEKGDGRREKGEGSMGHGAWGRGTGQEVVMEVPDLNQLPILKCWPADGGRFITLPAVHTVHPETGIPNVGMYRMQVFDKEMTGMHWHRHKTGAAHFEKYKELGRKMPVTVTLGGDPVYIYAATAPMPENLDEYLLAGFLRKKKVRLVKCLTNDLYVPEDVDFVIEGYVDPQEELIWEGPFGDHTGFYSLADWFPRFHVTCITHRKDAVYPATIVGVPPMEDAWIGKATERIFLSPIRLTMIPELTDMDLPFAGVAHNISIVKIKKSYPGQAVKVMHSLWGAGQMMFNKILIVVDDVDKAWGIEHGAWGAIRKNLNSEISNHKSQINQSPIAGSQPAADIDIHNYAILAQLFAENFNPAYSLHFSKGPLDILDHSSTAYAFGSKLGIDLTRLFPEEIPTGQPSNPLVPSYPRTLIPNVLSVPNVIRCTNLIETQSLPVLLLTVKKEETYNKKDLEKELAELEGMEQFKAVFLFNDSADLKDLFMLVWLVGGNLEPDRDISNVNTPSGTSFVLVDATIKTHQHDHFKREWPNVVTMDNDTISVVDEKWTELGLGDQLPSPSLKIKPLVMGAGATFTY